MAQDQNDVPQEFFDEMFALVTAVMEETITPEQWARLEQLVIESDEALELYLKLMYESMALRWRAEEHRRQDQNQDAGEDEDPFDRTGAETGPPGHQRASPRPRDRRGLIPGPRQRHACEHAVGCR